VDPAGSKDGYSLLKAIRSRGVDQQYVRDRLIRLLSSSGSLVVFDNYQNLVDSSVRSLIKNLASANTKLDSKVLVISREKPDFYVDRASYMELRGLSLEETKEFFSLLGLGDADAEAAYKELRGHPYLLLLYASSLKLASNRDSSVLNGVKRYLVSEILDQLSDEERRVLEAASAFDNPVPYKALRWFLKEAKEARVVIRSLVSKMLLERRGEHYVVNSLVKSICYDEATDKAGLHKKIAEYHLAHKEGELDLLKALYHYSEAGDYKNASRLASEILEKNRFLSRPKSLEVVKHLYLLLARSYLLSGDSRESKKIIKLGRETHLW
jgi:ATP/maltotriose-dependent transcriptional regulator MalT